jgi:hypothetical protein
METKMNTQISEIPMSESSNSWNAMSKSADEAASILSGAAQDQFNILSLWGATEIAECMSLSSWYFAPGGSDYLMSKTPTLLLGQCERAVTAFLDSTVVLFRTQRQIVEWGARSLSKNVGPAVSARSGSDAALSERRVSAHIINFPERRAIQMARSQAAAERSQAPVQAKANHRSSRRMA